MRLGFVRVLSLIPAGYKAWSKRADEVEISRYFQASGIPIGMAFLVDS